MSVEQAIEQKLMVQFAPTFLEVHNDSHLHSGHAGSPGTGQSHFRVRVVSQSFADQTRIERHRAVNAALADELAGPIHALNISALTPEEFAARNS
jgi:stress-induced morphogen